MSKYIPNISGFVDFCEYHANGEPIYISGGNLYADFDMLKRLDCKYNFVFANSRQEIEKAIADNMYMFDVEETQQFYYPNSNMFSMSNAERNIKGFVLRLKKKYGLRGRYEKL